MALQHERRVSLEEYHQIERASDVKYEYSDGHLYAMLGGTLEHSRIAGNLYIKLDAHLQGKRCCVYNSDAKVLPLEGENPSYYPDVTVTCEPEDYKHGSTAIRSPHLIIEVLSPSTASKDRGEKMLVYQLCPSIEEYVIVSTHCQQVEVYHRENAQEWIFRRYTAEQNVTFISVGLTIPVSEIYASTDVPPISSVFSAG